MSNFLYGILYFNILTEEHILLELQVMVVTELSKIQPEFTHKFRNILIGLKTRLNYFNNIFQLINYLQIK